MSGTRKPTGPNAPVEESTVAEPTEMSPKKISTDSLYDSLSTGQVPVADTPSPAYPLSGVTVSVGAGTSWASASGEPNVPKVSRAADIIATITDRYPMTDHLDVRSLGDPAQIRN
jgi:hypothetical protein